MTSVYTRVKEYLSPSNAAATKSKSTEEQAEEGTSTTNSTTTALNGRGHEASETTSLLGGNNNHTIMAISGEEVDPVQEDVLHPLPTSSPSVHDFYFTPSTNPTVQRYYRFTATPITPIVALHKKAGSGNSAIITSGVTGLLRRSAVVPSHGTDASGEWILVSVGGRSGWARKKLPEQHFSGFTLAERFQATEGWMGNHSFLCKGKLMLGSDAPSLAFTNVLLFVGYAFHFAVVIPQLQVIEDEHPDMLFGRLHTHAIFWASVVLGTLSIVTLWISALMDPGIIPPVSSPAKAPVPPDHIPLGGPLGYRYCSSCNIFRPPRSKHCNSCNVCVSKFDQ
jgi:hypothetical protein